MCHSMFRPQHGVNKAYQVPPIPCVYNAVSLPYALALNHHKPMGPSSYYCHIGL